MRSSDIGRADPETEEREYGPLLKIRDNFPKTVVSLDTMHAENRDGIRWMNLIEFLLKRES